MDPHERDLIRRFGLAALVLNDEGEFRAADLAAAAGSNARDALEFLQIMRVREISWLRRCDGVVYWRIIDPERLQWLWRNIVATELGSGISSTV